MKHINSSSRRQFFGTIAAGASVSLGALATPLQAFPSLDTESPGFSEEWLKKIKGKHKVVYDAPEPHEGFSIIWSWVFYKTNNETGSPDSDITAVVVLRHNAIPFAMQDSLWPKYQFGEMFGVHDPGTTTFASKNPFWEPNNDMFNTLGIQGMKALQERGVIFTVCDMALSVYSMMTAQKLERKPEEVKKEWVDGLLPGINVVPSGVWALQRAQQKGCAYIFAG